MLSASHQCALTAVLLATTNMGLAAARVAARDAPAYEKDEVKALPGWDGALPSRHFSGYLQVPGDYGNKYYHYWCALQRALSSRSQLVNRRRR